MRGVAGEARRRVDAEALRRLDVQVLGLVVGRHDGGHGVAQVGVAPQPRVEGRLRAARHRGQRDFAVHEALHEVDGARPRLAVVLE